MERQGGKGGVTNRTEGSRKEEVESGGKMKEEGLELQDLSWLKQRIVAQNMTKRTQK